MAVLTAKCRRAFVVSPEQSKKFLEQKNNSKTQNKKEETLSKISSKIKLDKSINNLVLCYHDDGRFTLDVEES